MSQVKQAGKLQREDDTGTKTFGKTPNSTSEIHLELESNTASAHPTFQSPCHLSQLVKEAPSHKPSMLHQNLWVQIPSFALHGIGCDHMAQKRMCWCLHNQNTRGPKPHQKGGSASPVEPRAQLKGCEPYFQIHKWLLPRPLPICATTLPFISKKQRGNVLSSLQGHCKAMTVKHPESSWCFAIETPLEFQS